MNFQLFRILGFLGLSIVIAAFLGYAIATQNYQLIVLLGAGVVFLFAVISPGYSPLLALGLLSPFTLPLPFIWGFPPVALIIGICLLKRGLSRGLSHRVGGRNPSAVVWSFWLFFSAVFLRYCLDPVLPNASGFGANVTGFRPYMNYGICFALLLTLGYFVQSRSDLRTLMRWCAIVAVCFILLLIPLMFTRSFGVANVLTYLGLYVTTYDNGIFRFVVLPGFGVILMSVAMLPDLVSIRRSSRAALFLLGLIAVILGGNRSGLAMATAVILLIPLLQKNVRRFASITALITVLYGGAYFAGEHMSHRGAGLLRVLTLISPRLAENTQSAGTWEFREIRWRAALQEIKNRPWIGRGYGGVQNAFVWNDWNTVEEARLEIDLATGGVHNGYLACALAFGIPVAMLFIGILVWAIWHNGQLAFSGKDPLARSVHAFVCANLVAYALSIYIGTDLNNPMIWFLIALGVLVERIRQPNDATTASMLSQHASSAVPVGHLSFPNANQYS